MKREENLYERIEDSRTTLAKQDAWAHKGTEKLLRDGVCVEERQYGVRPAERLDYIYPVNMRDKKLPVVIYIHGGGWIAGTKEARRLYCRLLAERGFFVVNIEYSLAPEAQFPSAIEECIRAISWFGEVAGSLPADLARIAVAGESAGVYYAIYLAVLSKNRQLSDTLGLHIAVPESFDVKAVFSNCGVADLASYAHSGFPNAALDMAAFTGLPEEEIIAGKHDEMLSDISPLRFISNSFPRTLLMYGSMDILRTNTFLLQKRFDALGIPYELYRCSGVFYGQHTSNMIFKFRKAFRIFNNVVHFFETAV